MIRLLDFIKRPFARKPDHALERERDSLHAQRDDERRLTRMARNEFMETLTQGVMNEIKGRR